MHHSIDHGCTIPANRPESGHAHDAHATLLGSVVQAVLQGIQPAEMRPSKNSSSWGSVATSSKQVDFCSRSSYMAQLAVLG